MFHPAAPNLKRIESPQEFEEAWLGVFARIKKTSGRDSPPYMNLQPQDVKIQLLSRDIALVTFHLVDGTTLSRRSIIFKRSPREWKIVHIHASNLTLPPASSRTGFGRGSNSFTDWVDEMDLLVESCLLASRASVCGDERSWGSRGVCIRWNRI